MTSEIPVVLVVSGTQGLMSVGECKTLEVGTPNWYDWLRASSSFRFESGFAGEESFTARKHERDSGNFWYAYRKVAGKLRNAYLGKTESLTLEKMLSVAVKLSQPQPSAEEGEQSKSYAKECITGDSQVVELQTKVSQLENQLTALQEELAHWKAKAVEAAIVVPNLEDELQLVQKG